MTGLVPAERIERAILEIRGLRVMLDADLAALYGVSTKALNQAVKRNLDRFPATFMFRLTAEERREVVTVCDHLRNLKYTRALPQAFTEHGAIMLASVLKSRTAVVVSVRVVEAFVRLRHAAASHADLARKVDDLERKYDGQFRAVFDAIRRLMESPEERRERIGFHGGSR